MNTNKEAKFKYTNLGNGVTEITAPLGEKIYVIEGKNLAMVIDTGMGIGSLNECIRKFCPLPLIVVNTHGHPDHTGGNIEFEKVYLHMNDIKLYQQMVTRKAREEDMQKKVKGEFLNIYEENLLDFAENILPLCEGDKFDLGGRQISTYMIEGHTAGSVVFYDSLTKWLFVGDAICLGDTWVHLKDSLTLVEYRDALLRFLTYQLDFKKILSGHEPNIAEPELFNMKLELLNKVISGELVGEETKTFVGKGKCISYNGTSLIYDENKIKKLI